MDNALPGHGGFVEQAHIAKGIVIYGQLDDLVGQLRQLAAVCLVLQPVNELLAPVAVKAAHVEITAPAEGAVDKVVGVAVLSAIMQYRAMSKSRLAI